MELMLYYNRVENPLAQFEEVWIIHVWLAANAKVDALTGSAVPLTS